MNQFISLKLKQFISCNIYYNFLYLFRTKYEIDGITDFFGTRPHGVGYAIEYFLKKYLEKKLLEHIKIIEQECLKTNNIKHD